MQKPSVYAGCGNLRERGVTSVTKRKNFCYAPKPPVLQGKKGIVTDVTYIFILNIYRKI